MISQLRGLLIVKQAPGLVIDVQGVGYELEAPMSTFANLPDLHNEVTVLTHLAVREDALNLYGFSTPAERQLFRELIRISGVGAKLALSILSAMDLQLFITSVQQGDTSRLVRIPGIGKKTSERLILELRDKMDSIAVVTTLNPNKATFIPGIKTVVEDAISALIALGYKSAEANRLVHAVYQEGLSSEMLIRRALQAALTT